jgi:site-specific DNA-methyltransferase (adenine-specific)
LIEPVIVNGQTLYHADCFDAMALIPDGSVNLICTDPPYGSTNCTWDSVLPLEKMWAEFKRILKPIGAIVITGSEPFSSTLRMSNTAQYKYDMVWQKSRPTGHVHAKNKPLKIHENVMVFSPGTTVHRAQSSIRMTYNPQGLIVLQKPIYRKKRNGSNVVMAPRASQRATLQTISNYPVSILKFSSTSDYLHPTQKPVSLFEYLVRTYSNEGETVLDCCAGSMTTAIACINSDRHSICIERDDTYFAKGVERVMDHDKPDENAPTKPAKRTPRKPSTSSNILTLFDDIAA